MNTQRFLSLVSEGYTLEVAEKPKHVVEGDKEKPVEQELVEAYLVSPFEVPDMIQNEDKNIPVQRKRLDGSGLTTPVKVPVPHVLYKKLEASGFLRDVKDYKPAEKKAA